MVNYDCHKFKYDPESKTFLPCMWCGGEFMKVRGNCPGGSELDVQQPLDFAPDLQIFTLEPR